MTATVTPFPTPRFTPSDRAELLRWSAEAAAVAGWWVWQDPETGALVDRTEAGADYASLTHAQAEDGCAYTVAPRRGRWELTDRRDALVGTFGTLREALEAVCRTISSAA